MSRLPNATLNITSRTDAEQLIRDIRRAVRNSARTGGGYGVYRRDDDGTYPVAIEVNIKPETQACRRCDSPLRHGCGLLWAI